VEPLRALGFRPATVGRAVATGTVELDRIAELVAHPNVVRIALARTGEPLLDKSVPAIHADAVHRAPLESRGEGVIVGVIDDGIDFRHPCFLHPDDQTSRILFIWDQILEAEDGEHPPAAEGFAYGVEWDQDAINETLEGFGICRHEGEPDGHGTLVAGIAAGDGSVAGNCRGAHTFVGVAPAADLIVVRWNYTETGIADAASYIFRKAAARRQPAVVNVSLGIELGPHDGTTEFNELLDELLDVAGRAIVFGAGNAAEKSFHAQDTLTPASPSPQTVQFEVEPETKGMVLVDLWYPGGQPLGIAVRPPNRATAVPATPVTSGNDAVLVFPGLTTAGTLAHQFDFRNLDEHVSIVLMPQTGLEVERGSWQIVLHGTATAPMTYHCWITALSRTGGARFVTPQVASRGTINDWATGARIITVGAFATEGESTGQLAASSGRGPTRDGRRKPVAPGVAITTARYGASVEEACCCDCCVDMYIDKSGTSLAAPHVAGVVALMLEGDPTMPIAEIRGRLLSAADAPGVVPPPVLPDDHWGAGIVNALRAVSPGPVPIGGGSDGIRPAPAVLPGRDVTALLAALRRRVLASPDGQLYAALVSRHFSEIRGLVNTNRRVAAIWRRASGPVLIGRLLRESHDESAASTRADEAPPRREQLERFFATVARFATQSLRDDLAEHGGGFTRFLLRSA
jgi:subtilisin family serine protease